MPNKTITSVQGQMWDHLSLAQYGDERGMREVAAANIEFMDMLVLSGDRKMTIPEVSNMATKPVRTLPPWERM